MSALSTTIWVLRAVFDQGYPPKSQFSVDDIPDLTGKVMIVTGANTGLGKETVKVRLDISLFFFSFPSSQSIYFIFN